MKFLVLPLTCLALACDKPAPEPTAAPAPAPAPVNDPTTVASPATTEGAAPAPAHETPTTVGAPKPEGDGPKATGKFGDVPACDFLNTAQVAGVLGLDRDAVKATEEGRPSDHRKICRYTWMAGDTQGSLTLDIAYRREGPASAQFDRAVAERRAGIPVAGRDGVVQAFAGINGLGDEALYSSNVSDMKSIFVVIGNAKAVSLQHAVVGTDTGDLKASLVALARPVVGKLSRLAL